MPAKSPVSGNSKRQALIVLGMHRSGTSAVSGVFALLGAQPPKSLLPPTSDNPRGYWESRELMNFHDFILESVGSSWSDWEGFNPDWIDSPAGKDFRQQLSDVVGEEYGDADLILVKDPRMCRFFPLWKDALPTLGFVPKIVIPVRHPLEVVESLRRRDEMAGCQAKLLWLRHILDAEYSTRDTARVFIRYSDMLEDWQSQAKKVAARLEIKWPRWSGSTKAKVDDYLIQDLRHHTAASATALASSTNPGIASWVQDAYVAVERLVDEPEQRDALATLDAIRQRFDETAEIYAPVVREQRIGHQRRLEQLFQQRSKLEQRLAELGQKHESLGLENRANYQKYVDQELQTSALSEKLSELESAFASTLSSNESLRAEISALADSKDLLRTEMTERLRERERAFGELFAKHEAFQEMMNAKVNKLTSKVQFLEQELEEMESRHHRALAEVTAPLNSEIRLLQREARKSEDVAHEHHLEIANLTRLLLDAEERISRDQDQYRRESAQQQERLEAERLGLQALQQTLDEERARHAALHQSMLDTLRGLEFEIEEQRRLIVDYKSSLDQIHGSKYWRIASFLRRFGKRGESPAISDAEPSDEQTISESGLFDARWYLERYPDVRASGMDPVIHYVEHGAREGRDPSAVFSTSSYLARYADVASIGINPLVHYVKHGRREGRLISTGEGSSEH